MNKKTYTRPSVQSYDFACRDAMMDVPIEGSATRPGSGALTHKREANAAEREHAIWKEE